MVLQSTITQHQNKHPYKPTFTSHCAAECIGEKWKCREKGGKS